MVRLPALDVRALGKAATRLAERTTRPAAVLAESQGKLIAELRGPEGVHLVEVLSEMRELFESWGGHRTAAGFSAEPARAADIEARLGTAFAAWPAPAPPPLVAEADVRRVDVDASFSRSIRAAMPFGRGNPSPVFRIADYRDGGALLGGDESGHVTVDLIESGFPPRSEGRLPLVTFLPKGRGGLVVRFEGWAAGRRER